VRRSGGGKEIDLRGQGLLCQGRRPPGGRERQRGRERERERERVRELKGRDERGDYYLASAFQGALISVIFLGQGTVVRARNR
jgi:hypothetical protein